MKKSNHNRENFSKYYGSLFGGKLFRWLDIKKYRLIVKALSGLPKTLNILDLGCGAAGISSRLLTAHFCTNLVGLDVDLELLETAQKRGLSVVKASFDDKLPFASESFGAVLMIDTIEHVKSRNRTIHEVLRVLRREGLFIVFTPPYDSISWLVGEWFFKVVTRRQSDHISPFTRESLTYLLNRHFEYWHIRLTNWGLTLYGVGVHKMCC